MKILFRKELDLEDEFSIAKKYFGSDIVESRCAIRSYSEVLGRYSVLPYYKELEFDLKHKESHLIVGHSQHEFIANFKYIDCIYDLTPKTYIGDWGYQNVPDSKHGWIVKGLTNSRKWLWNTHMYAPTREHLKNVMYNLSADSLIGQQDLVIREYVPLKTHEIGINDLPMTEEWRIFFFKGQLVAGGFYWSIAEIADKKKKIPHWAAQLAFEVQERLEGVINTFCIDVAETAEGDYIVVELNDLQMSGLCCTNPDEFYKNLKRISDQKG